MNLPRLISLRPLLVLAALVGLALPARADFVLDDGGGHATPTGGVAASGSGQQHSTNAYSLDSDGWYGNGAGGPSSTCSGKVHYAWTRQGSGSPPSQVVLKVESYANWGGASGGSASAGIDGAVYTTNTGGPGGPVIGGTSQGTAYLVKDSSSGSVTYDVEPHASDGGGSVSAKVRVTLTPVEIVFGGGIGPNAAKRYLIGQACSATISAPLPVQVTGTQPTWTVSGGQPFQSWSATRDAATFNTPPAPLVGTTSIGWYFKTREDNATVTFSGHLVVPSGSQPAAGLDVSLTRNCRSEIPASASLSAYTYQNAGSLALPGYPANGVGLYTQPNPTIMSILGVSAPKYGPGGTGVVGIRWDAYVQTPSDFGGGGGWNFVQLIDPQRTRVYHGVQQTLPINGHTGLDNTYPYEPGPYDPDSGSPGTVPADGNGDYFGDAPSVGLGWPDVTHVTANESFETWLMYRPPGTGSTFVPLKALTWNWAGEASTDGMGVWSMGSSDSGWYFDSDYPPHPEWSSRLDNSQLGSWTPSVP